MAFDGLSHPSHRPVAGCCGMSRAVKQAEFARILGVSRSTVTRARQAGRLVIDERGRVLVDESLQRYHETAGGRTDVAERHAETRGAALPPAEAVEEDAQSDGSDDAGDSALPEDPGDDHTRTRLKAMALHYSNQQAKIELALRRHQRYRIEDVRQESLTLGSRVRAGVERLIDEMAPRLRLLSPQERQDLIAERCGELAQEIRTEFRRAQARLKSGGRR